MPLPPVNSGPDDPRCAASRRLLGSSGSPFPDEGMGLAMRSAMKPRTGGSILWWTAMLVACGGESHSSPVADAMADGASGDAAVSDDRASPTDAAPAGDARSMPDAGDAADAPLMADGPLAADGAALCPASCPTGQIVVNWNDSVPGFPGPSGCGCTPDPCPDGGECACQPACIQTGHQGCCNWTGGTLVCDACG
jgi:hypothetical protein